MELQPLYFSYFCACLRRSGIWPQQSSEHRPGCCMWLYMDQGEICEFRIINFFLLHATTTSTKGSPPERGELAHDKTISFETGRHGFSFLLCYRFSLWTSESNLGSLWFSVRCKIVVIAWPFITSAHKRKCIKETLRVSHYYMESPRERSIYPEEMN